MKKKTIVPMMIVAAACSILCGCASTPPLTYNLETAAQMLVQRMQCHSQFTKNYNAVKSVKGKLPVVCLSPLNNRTSSAEARSLLRTADDMVRVALFDTGIFEVKDDDSADLLKSRIIWGADGGIENVSDIMKTLGEQDAPDFIVSGDLRRSADIDGYPVYRLRLSVYNLKTGKVVWEGIQTKVSL